MIYKDGFEMDENLRVKKCPKCGNEEFSREAEYCRICGTYLYNTCDGIDIRDEYGNVTDHVYHNNPGNARFCELCGKPTSFFNNKFLKPFNEVKNTDIEDYIVDHATSIVTPATPPYVDSEDFDDMPF